MYIVQVCMFAVITAFTFIISLANILHFSLKTFKNVASVILVQYFYNYIFIHFDLDSSRILSCVFSSFLKISL